MGLVRHGWSAMDMAAADLRNTQRTQEDELYGGRNESEASVDYWASHDNLSGQQAHEHRVFSTGVASCDQLGASSGAMTFSREASVNCVQSVMSMFV